MNSWLAPQAAPLSVSRTHQAATSSIQAQAKVLGFHTPSLGPCSLYSTSFHILLFNLFNISWICSFFTIHVVTGLVQVAISGLSSCHTLLAGFLVCAAHSL